MCECELPQSYERSCIILLQYYILVNDVSEGDKHLFLSYGTLLLFKAKYQ